MNIFKALSGYMKKHPQSDCQGNAQPIDFSISSDDKLVVYAGGAEKKCRTAEQVIEAVGMLLDIVDDLKCVIICGGKNIGEKAQKANESLGKNVIFTVDENFPDIIAAAKLFIGEGRLLKDAMLAGKPVILAGEGGYVGIFDESKKEKCIEAEFICKNEIRVESGLLAQDIGAFFGLWEDEQESLGKYAQKIMAEYEK